ncbi:MAG: hypothetical protein Hens3KO_29250 [Henriciella sp.]
MTKIFNRRDALRLGGGIAAAGGVAACATAAQPASDATPYAPMELDNPKWNRDAIVKLQGNMDPAKEKYGWYAGRVIGVRDGEKDTHLMDFEGFSVARMLPREDGSYRKVLREVGFYLDKDTGEIMETYENPYTGETNKVVPIANDPFNVTFEEFYPEPPRYGGLNNADRPPRRPLLLDWTVKGDTVFLHSDIHLFYPSSLQPSEWPRESPGPMTQVTEMFSYNIKRADLENPDLQSIEHFGVWNRITPWFPWMLMDQAQGHLVYACDFGSHDTMEMVPQKIIDAAAAIDPKYLEAPTEDYGPNLSSLENYKLTETPAPPRDK